MKIIDILNNGKVNVSCELFPPKSGSELTGAKKIVDEIATLHPAFMSVTYGASGTGGKHTVEIANQVQNVNSIPALAHLTCVNATKEKINSVLDQLKERKIENILALRGDLPEDCEISGDYKHASDLMNQISSYGDFCIGGACYPEGHPESKNKFEDIENLKIKLANGCSFCTTQMFFDNTILYNYMFHLLKQGINIPVVAGIMPVTNSSQIKRICSLSGTKLPPRFIAIADKFADSPLSMKQAGIAYATEQIIDLIANGITNIHIYTMNKPDIAARIMGNLSEIIN